MQFFSSSEGTSTLRHLPVHASAERGAGAPLRSLPLQHTPPLGEKQSWICLFLTYVPFMLGLIKENVYTKYDLRKFVIVSGVCIKIIEHVGLNKYYWHIYKVTMTYFTTSHIQQGEGVRAIFFNSEGAKINNSLGPPVFDLLDTPLDLATNSLFRQFEFMQLCRIRHPDPNVGTKLSIAECFTFTHLFITIF